MAAYRDMVPSLYNIKPYLAGGGLRAPGFLLGRGLLHGAGGRGGGGPRLCLRLALRLGLLQGQVHAEGDSGGGAVLLEPVQVSAQEHMRRVSTNPYGHHSVLHSWLSLV